VKEIFAIIKRINQDGMTILLVEQNANMALQAAEHGFVIENGRIVLDDDCKSLMEDDDIKEFYLGLSGNQQREEKRWKRRKGWG
jgi:branched-chain amino acid transport system ATP-binding protein